MLILHSSSSLILLLSFPHPPYPHPFIPSHIHPSPPTHNMHISPNAHTTFLIAPYPSLIFHIHNHLYPNITHISTHPHLPLIPTYRHMLMLHSSSPPILPLSFSHLPYPQPLTPP
nr:putative uncharacterized protein YHR217C [Penaeus vannamei]